MDAKAHLRTLVGTTIHTIGHGRPNRILAIDGTDVIVATGRSPAGQRVAIAEVQAALDMLERTDDLLIDKKVVGYRSAFIGAVLGTLPGAITSTRPRRVRLERRGTTEPGMSDVLPDLIAPNLRVVFTGTAVGAASARAGAYYAGPGNAFWPTLHAIGLTPRRLPPHEYGTLLDFGIGLTDVCKIASGSDREVGRGGFDVPRFLAVLQANRPRIVAFNGKQAARIVLDRQVSYGRQPELLADAAVWVLPSTSAAARGYWDIAPWRQLANDAAT